MKFIITLFTVLSLTALLAGCKQQTTSKHAGHDHSGHEHAAETPAAPAPHPADTEQILQVGCAGCIYEQDWAEGCQTAVKVGDQVLLVKGVDFNAHKKGLCKAEKTARITGHAEADHFAATQIEIQP